jgi:hypothetical protein
MGAAPSAGAAPGGASVHLPGTHRAHTAVSWEEEHSQEEHFHTIAEWLPQPGLIRLLSTWPDVGNASLTVLLPPPAPTSHSCVRDQNGNHVVQKCIECVQPSDPARAMIEVGRRKRLQQGCRAGFEAAEARGVHGIAAWQVRWCTFPLVTCLDVVESKPTGLSFHLHGSSKRGCPAVPQFGATIRSLSEAASAPLNARRPRPLSMQIIVNKGQSLSTHTFGCRLVQRVLEYCSIPELRERVVTGEQPLAGPQLAVGLQAWLPLCAHPGSVVGWVPSLVIHAASLQTPPPPSNLRLLHYHLWFRMSADPPVPPPLYRCRRARKHAAAEPRPVRQLRGAAPGGQGPPARQVGSGRAASVLGVKQPVAERRHAPRHPLCGLQRVMRWLAGGQQRASPRFSLPRPRTLPSHPAPTSPS